MSDKISWLTYDFGVYTHGATWTAVAGVYIFCFITPENRWRALYVGQTDDFQGRIPNHERWTEAVQAGATHVHARVEKLGATRDLVEAELIQAYQPPLNVQLKSPFLPPY